jgi:hypothetical protein
MPQMTETETNGNGSTTLSWANLNLNVVDTQPTERTEVPAGNYAFRLVGAKPSPYQVGTTDIDLVITEGPQSKRHVFASLPTPDKGKWVVQAASLLIKALGGTHQPGEELVDTLNRLASNGAGKFTADVSENRYIKDGEEKVGRPRLQYFSIQPAA